MLLFGMIKGGLHNGPGMAQTTTMNGGAQMSLSQQILDELKKGPRRVVELAQMFNKSVNVTSGAVHNLKMRGLIISRRYGVWELDNSNSRGYESLLGHYQDVNMGKFEDSNTDRSWWEGYASALVNNGLITEAEFDNFICNVLE